MELVRGLHCLRPDARGSAVTIGNFDGVHLGHRAVLEQLRGAALARRLPATVVLFEPQPREYFQGHPAQPRITRLRDKCRLLRAAGIDRVVCLRFDAALAALSADAFVERVLLEGLGTRLLITGDDFRFGHARSGSYELLAARAAGDGFELLRAASFTLDGVRVSSTAVREALARHDLDGAARLLGARYAVSGRVVHGHRNGRRMGYPTANIELRPVRLALRGIYSAQVDGLPGGRRPAVAYIGSRPIIQGERDLLEVHVLDYAGDCYGRHLCVEFVAHLRDDRPFESFEALRAQIDIDILNARRSLAEA